MASTYTPLGVELQATGENAGTWGTKTNTNLQIIEQITGGFTTQAVSDSGDTDLSVSDGSTGATLAHRVLEFTGSLTGARNVTIPLDVQTFYVLKNSTSGSQNVVFKYVSGSGDSITLAPGAVKMVYATANDGTNPDIDDTGFITASSTDTLTNKTLTSPKIGTSILDTNGNELALLTATSSAVNEFTIANAATGAGPTLSSTGGDSNIDINITPKGTGDVVLAGDTVKVGDSGAAATLTSNGAGALTITTGGTEDLVLSTNSGTNSGTITITDGANNNITLQPNGTGDVVAAADTLTVGDAAAAATISSNGAGTLTLTTGGASDLILSTNGGTDSGTITITDAANGNIAIAPNGSGNIVLDGLTFPNADGSADTFLKTNGSGTLSFAAVSGGTDWQAVKTGNYTASAGEGVFANTTSGAWTLTLPASPSIGDEVSFVDYAGTFDSNNLTIGRNGSKIAGATADLTVSTERAANTLVFTDSTQGWLLKNK